MSFRVSRAAAKREIPMMLLEDSRHDADTTYLATASRCLKNRLRDFSPLPGVRNDIYKDPSPPNVISREPRIRTTKSPILWMGDYSSSDLGDLALFSVNRANGASPILHVHRLRPPLYSMREIIPKNRPGDDG